MSNSGRSRSRCTSRGQGLVQMDHGGGAGQVNTAIVEASAAEALAQADSLDEELSIEADHGTGLQLLQEGLGGPVVPAQYAHQPVVSAAAAGRVGQVQGQHAEHVRREDLAAQEGAHEALVLGFPFGAVGLVPPVLLEGGVMGELM